MASRYTESTKMNTKKTTNQQRERIIRQSNFYSLTAAVQHYDLPITVQVIPEKNLDIFDNDEFERIILTVIGHVSREEVTCISKNTTFPLAIADHAVHVVSIDSDRQSFTSIKELMKEQEREELQWFVVLKSFTYGNTQYEVGQLMKAKPPSKVLFRSFRRNNKLKVVLYPSLKIKSFPANITAEFQKCSIPDFQQPTRLFSEVMRKESLPCLIRFPTVTSNKVIDKFINENILVTEMRSKNISIVCKLLNGDLEVHTVPSHINFGVEILHGEIPVATLTSNEVTIIKEKIIHNDPKKAENEHQKYRMYDLIEKIDIEVTEHGEDEYTNCQEMFQSIDKSNSYLEPYEKHLDDDDDTSASFLCSEKRLTVKSVNGLNHDIGEDQTDSKIPKNKPLPDLPPSVATNLEDLKMKRKSENIRQDRVEASRENETANETVKSFMNKPLPALPSPVRTSLEDLKIRSKSEITNHDGAERPGYLCLINDDGAYEVKIEESESSRNILSKKIKTDHIDSDGYMSMTKLVDENDGNCTVPADRMQTSKKPNMKERPEITPRKRLILNDKPAIAPKPTSTVESVKDLSNVCTENISSTLGKVRGVSKGEDLSTTHTECYLNLEIGVQDSCQTDKPRLLPRTTVRASLSNRQNTSEDDFHEDRKKDKPQLPPEQRTQRGNRKFSPIRSVQQKPSMQSPPENMFYQNVWDTEHHYEYEGRCSKSLPPNLLNYDYCEDELFSEIFDNTTEESADTSLQQEASLAKISTISIPEVVNLLKVVSIEHKSEIFEMNDVDGALLVDLDEEALKSLGLTHFEARKLHRYVNGWRPRKDSSCETISDFSVDALVDFLCDIKLHCLSRFAKKQDIDGRLMLDLIQDSTLLNIQHEHNIPFKSFELVKLKKSILEGYQPKY